MEIGIRHFGIKKTGFAAIIEVYVNSLGTEIVEDVTDASGHVDEVFIEQLQYVVCELKKQNQFWAKKTKKHGNIK